MESILGKRKADRGLYDILTSRKDEPFVSVLCTEGPELWNRYRGDVADCSVDFALLPSELKAAAPFLRQPRDVRERSQEWIAVRLTLEHLVYFLARLQLFLAGAVADAYAHMSDVPRARFGFSASVQDGGLSPTRMLMRWKRLLKRRVAEDDVAAEHRLIADALLFVGSAQQHCSKLLLLLLSGKL